MLATWAMVGVWACVATPAEWTRPGANLAAGRPYTLAPTPNYALCSHDEDRRLLTDGVYTSGYFWTQPTTTGWQGGVTPRIVVDLGSVSPKKPILSLSNTSEIWPAVWPGVSMTRALSEPSFAVSPPP